MLYMKEDDMDEMMRKAAANYEVDAEKASDWNAVYNAVHVQDGLTPVVEEKKKKRRFAFWWLLLIPVGWVANTEYSKFKNAHTEQVATSPATQSKNNNDKQTAPATTELKTDTVKNNSTAQVNNTPAAKQTNAFSLKRFTTNTNSPAATQTNSNSDLNNNNTGLPSQQPGNNQQQASSQQGVPGNITSVDKSNNAGSTPPDKTVAANETSASPALINDTATQQKNNAIASKPAIKKQKSDAHYFYAGLMAGADLSFIKYQDAQPLGYNVGLLVGYKFNKRLSVESGFYLAKKNYYTKGEYFDKSKLHYFDTRTMVDATGYCKMFEIPLSIKYDISTRKNHTWFATAGLTSYLMNKEYYYYNVDSSGYSYSGSKPYYNTSQNWFSVLNLSAGYELKTGNKTNLRIEPYFKKTLTGAGLGNLSIESFGINAGIVRKIP